METFGSLQRVEECIQQSMPRCNNYDMAHATLDDVEKRQPPSVDGPDSSGDEHA